MFCHCRKVKTESAGQFHHRLSNFSLHLKKEKKVENQNEIAEQVGEKND